MRKSKTTIVIGYGKGYSSKISLYLLVFEYFYIYTRFVVFHGRYESAYLDNALYNNCVSDFSWIPRLITKLNWFCTFVSGTLRSRSV